MNNRGLTLLELLVAIAILAIITAIVYGAFSSVVEGVENARQTASEMRVREFLTYNLERDFAGAYIHPYLQPPVVPYTFEGQNDDSPDGPDDSIEFYTTAPVLGGRAMPGEIKQVVISVIDNSKDKNNLDLNAPDENNPDNQDNQGDKPKRMLQVVETPMSSASIDNLGGLDQSGLTNSSSMFDQNKQSNLNNLSNQDAQTAMVEAPSWTIPVQSFDVEYYDGKQWVQEWSFADRLRLPWCVHIKINFPKTDAERKSEKEQGIDPEDNPDYEAVIPIEGGIGIISTPQEVPGLDPTIMLNNINGTEPESGRSNNRRNSSSSTNIRGLHPNNQSNGSSRSFTNNSRSGGQ